MEQLKITPTVFERTVGASHFRATEGMTPEQEHPTEKEN
jgi:hypothetical protein